MKIFLFFLGLIIPFQFLQAQQYELELPAIPSAQWTHPRWKAADSAENIRIRTLDRTWLGAVKKGQIFFDEEMQFKAERQNGRFLIVDKAGNLQVERRLPWHYILEDGTLLRRRRNIWQNKLKILHPDGRTLLEGRIRSNFVRHRLSMRVVSSTKWDEELLALFAIDMVEFLASR